MLHVAKMQFYVRQAERLGYDRCARAPDLSFRPAVVGDDDDFVSYDRAASALNCLSEALPEDFALRCGLATSLAEMGTVGFAMLNGGTYGEFVEQWPRFATLVGHPLEFEARVTKEALILEMRPRFPLSPSALRFCLEEAVANIGPLLREIGVAHDAILAVELAIPSSPNAARYASALPFEVRLDAPANRIINDLSKLSTPLRLVDKELTVVCANHCDWRLTKLEIERSMMQVIKELLEKLDVPDFALSNVADHLGMSKRSINRKLLAEDVTYEKVLRDFRRDRAFHLLTEGDLCVKRIAYMLGFECVTSFRRAFKLWTGMTVRDWQHSPRGSGIVAAVSRPARRRQARPLRFARSANVTETG